MLPGCWGSPALPRPGCPGPAACPPAYPLAEEEAVGVLHGRPFVQQQGLELALLDVIEGVEDHGQELGGRRA